MQEQVSARLVVITFRPRRARSGHMVRGVLRWICDQIPPVRALWSETEMTNSQSETLKTFAAAKWHFSATAKFFFNCHLQIEELQ